jgi:hypothetical protein
VSYDLRVFFPHPEFPTHAWYDVLATFQGDACHVTFSEDSSGQACIKDYSLVADGSLVSVDVRAMSDIPSLCAPAGTRWLATVSTGMGRSALAWWTACAIPYHALVFFPGAIVHDCQYHVGRSLAESSWTNPETWLQNCKRRLWRTLGSKAELIDRGLFGADGTVRF